MEIVFNSDRDKLFTRYTVRHSFQETNGKEKTGKASSNQGSPGTDASPKSRRESDRLMDPGAIDCVVALIGAINPYLLQRDCANRYGFLKLADTKSDRGTLCAAIASNTVIISALLLQCPFGATNAHTNMKKRSLNVDRCDRWERGGFL